MLYSSPNKVYPDLNYFFAPFCIPEKIKNDKNKNCNAERSLPIDNLFFQNNRFQNSFLTNRILTFFQPKTVKITIVNNENDEKEEIHKNKNLFLVSNHDISDSTLENTFDNISISNNEITKFNTDPNLKKIHSIYHLKRKINTKLQNDIRNTINNYISKFNMKNKDFKIPFLFSNSKSFREDVKNDTFKKIKCITISKYICEDLQIAGRSLNIHNLNVSKKIEEIYFICNNDEIKKIYNLLYKTYVYEYCEEFFNSERFKKCFEKDLAKYLEKLKKLNYSFEKTDLYKRIFKEKYEDIAKYFFTCN